MSVGHKVVARGIVIKSVPSGDGSVRVALYTDALGLVYAFAKSAREERSKLRPHLQPGTRGAYSLVKGKDTWRVTGAADTRSSHFDLVGFDEAQRSSSRVISFVRQFVRGEGSDPYFFETLWRFFDLLPYTDTDALHDAECLVILRMLASLGYLETHDAVSPFLALSYDAPLLSEARRSRTALVAMINEGMAASGLS